MNLRDALSRSNQNKVLSGQQIKSFISSQLSQLKNQGIINDFEENTNFRHRSYEYDKQFLANFVIYTHDNKRIIVNSSNSFRNDRAKIGFYDLDGILRFSNLSDDIISTIYLVGDQELNNPTFTRLREKFLNKEFYCPASHLFTLSEFVDFLQNYHDENSTILYDIQDELNFRSLKEAGSYYGIRGNKFEKEVSELLNDKYFFLKYKQGNASSPLSIILDKILIKHDLSKEDILKISATNSIPLLKNGGNPKTDIYLEIYNQFGDVISETISVKNTSKKRVSCHDYKSDDFIRVLNISGTKLEKYIKLFEEYPSKVKLLDNLPYNYTLDEFSDLMSEKSKILTEWALQGKHDQENIINPDKQISNFILINYNDEIHFFDYQDYINYIIKNSKQVFSTPFSWTYPSKQEGKRIQLKMPVVFNLD